MLFLHFIALNTAQLSVPSERPDPRVPVEGDPLLSPVVVSLDSVVGEVAAEQN